MYNFETSILESFVIEVTLIIVITVDVLYY